MSQPTPNDEAAMDGLLADVAALGQAATAAGSDSLTQAQQELMGNVADGIRDRLT